jgi:protein TonB
MSLLKRHAPALATVLLLHGGALWALQHGLLQRALDPITAPQMLVEVMLAEPAPESPRTTPQTREKARATVPAKAQMAQAKQPPALPPSLQPPEPAPQALAVANAAPSPLATPLAAPAPQSTAVSPASPAASSVATGATAPSTHAPGNANAPPALQQPSSDADYLNNPKPAYPAMSRRLGEQGKVVVHALIDADGVPQKAEILRSSGFERLDRAALETALKWRYVPAKRAGVPEAMWFNVPLHFVLD